LKKKADNVRNPVIVFDQVRFTQMAKIDRRRQIRRDCLGLAIDRCFRMRRTGRLLSEVTRKWVSLRVWTYPKALMWTGSRKVCYYRNNFGEGQLALYFRKFTKQEQCEESILNNFSHRSTADFRRIKKYAKKRFKRVAVKAAKYAKFCETWAFVKVVEIC